LFEGATGASRYKRSVGGRGADLRGGITVLEFRKLRFAIAKGFAKGRNTGYL